MLSLKGISKEYNLRPILEDIDFALEPGTAYALQAPNGSGKTTLLQIMAGLVRPTRGQVLWDGKPITVHHRRGLGVLLQQPMLYADLSGAENLRFFARLYGLEQAQDAVSQWLENVGLGEHGEERVRNYSKGMKQRLAVARCFIHSPKVLLLDEPFDGLDERGRDLLTRLLQEQITAKASIFLVTHRSEEVSFPAQGLTIHFGRVMAC